MPSRYSLPTLVILLACTLLTAVLPFLAASLSISHDPFAKVEMQLAQHGESVGVDQGPSGHQHEDASIEEGALSDEHTHSAADHTHESLFVPPEHSVTLGVGTPSWSPPISRAGTSAEVATLERPPKPATA